LKAKRATKAVTKKVTKKVIKEITKAFIAVVEGEEDVEVDNLIL